MFGFRENKRSDLVGEARSNPQNDAVGPTGHRSALRHVAQMVRESFFMLTKYSERSVEATASQVVGYDDVCHRVEHELNVVGVRRAGHVAVDLLRR